MGLNFYHRKLFKKNNMPFITWKVFRLQFFSFLKFTTSFLFRQIILKVNCLILHINYPLLLCLIPEIELIISSSHLNSLSGTSTKPTVLSYIKEWILNNLIFFNFKYYIILLYSFSNLFNYFYSIFSSWNVNDWELFEYLLT